MSDKKFTPSKETQKILQISKLTLQSENYFFSSSIFLFFGVLEEKFEVMKLSFKRVRK